MPSATSPWVSSYLAPSTTSAVFAGRSGLSLFCPRLLPSSDVWQQLGAKNNAPALGRRHSLQLITSKLTSRLTSSARARELMRMNQQREAKPALPGPKGIPSTVPVGITNILPSNIPTHPNAPKPAYVMVVSASGDPTKIGDCPFSQRVLMTLEEKHLPYEGRFIDVENKPTWFLEMYPEGKVPTMFIDQDWVGDADVITDMLETRISIPSMRTSPEKASIGLKVFPLFVKFLRSKDPGDGSEQAFLAELQALNEHLKIEDAAHKNPFVSGRFPSMLDMNLTPKLYHMDVALKHFKNWSLPQDLIHLEAYMKKMFARPSFTKTKSPEDVVIRGWQRHLSSIGQ